MQPPPPNGPPETPPAPSGTLRLRLERGAFQGPFTPLAPPLSVDLGLDGVGWDLLGRLHLQGELSLVEGHHPLPLLPDLEIHARVVAGTRAHLDLRLERTGPAGETRVAGFDLTFTSPVIIEDLVPLLLRLPGLFEDRGLQALRARGESLLAAAGLLLREHRELLELSSDLAARLRRGLERTGATAGGFPELLARLRPSTDGMVEVLLRRISARPVRRQDRWELDLRFSGETSTLDRMLVPFNDVRLPRAIVPSFHAALERLLSRSPAASARVRTDRLRTRELARALAGFADRFRASVDLAGEAPGVEVEGTTAAAGRFRVRITTPGTFSLQGEVSGRVSGTALQLRTRRLELAAGGTRTVVRGRVRVATRSKGPLVPALFERRPLDHLDLEFTGALEEGSTLPALHLSATTDHPLLLGTTGVEVALEHPTFGGDVSLRLGRSPSQAVDLRLAARFRTLPGTGFDNGQSVLEVSRLAGAVNGRIRSQAPRTFTVTLDGEARGMARTTTRVSPLPELDIEEGLVLDAGLDGELRYRTRLDTRPRSR
ncbi:MAG: hypothetical protein FJ098_03265, partial [Deltaproteobacteria bacterium]|nr:hypothetical protein [Deltaproteobacteria bacterium]